MENNFEQGTSRYGSAPVIEKHAGECPHCANALELVPVRDLIPQVRCRTHGVVSKQNIRYVATKEEYQCPDCGHTIPTKRECPDCGWTYEPKKTNAESPRYETTIDGRWIVTVGGLQWGKGPRDPSGASSETFTSKAEAIAAYRERGENSKANTKYRKICGCGYEGSWRDVEPKLGGTCSQCGANDNWEIDTRAGNSKTNAHIVICPCGGQISNLGIGKGWACERCGIRYEPVPVDEEVQ